MAIAKGVAQVVLAAGAILLAYLVLKSWGIISVSSVSSISDKGSIKIEGWKPLTQEQIEYIHQYINTNR